MIVDDAVYIDGRRSPSHLEPIRLHHEGPCARHPFSWVGVVDPTLPEMAAYQTRFRLSDLVLEDAATTGHRPKLDLADDSAVLLLRTVDYDAGQREIIVGEMALVFSCCFILSVRHGEAMPLQSLRRDLEAHPERLQGGVASVVHEIVDRIVDQYGRVCSRLQQDVADVEASVFDERRPDIATRLYFVKREISEFRRALLPLRSPLERIVAGDVVFLPEAARPLFSDVLDHLERTLDEAALLDELVVSAMQANFALVGVQQNSDMRKISAWIAIAAVPTVIAAIYGMNFANMPELDSPLGYPLALAVMGAAAVTIYLLMRRSRWL
ncbi:MAG: magnesium and cobalt transport protein CorA [Actinomycetales bacterium]|nr:magnesium and cobalt transport protein CorA [Actinomycetales bacterium]